MTTRKDINNKSLVRTALGLFVGDVVENVTKFDDVLMFKTERGLAGLVEQNNVGEWEIWVGEDVIYSIEDDIFSIMDHSGADETLFELYKSIKSIDIKDLKFQSAVFYDIVRRSVENLILNSTLPIEGSALVGPWEIIYKNKIKIRINLN